MTAITLFPASNSALAKYSYKTGTEVYSQSRISLLHLSNGLCQALRWAYQGRSCGEKDINVFNFCHELGVVLRLPTKTRV